MTEQGERHVPRVTVLMTVYEAGRFLEQSVRSVLDQTFTDWELLVMDDGSSDPLVGEVLDWLTFTVRDPRVIVVRYEPTPEERARTVRYATNINSGFGCTSGSLITYLAGDDYYLPDRLERMVREMDRLVMAGFFDGVVVYGSQRLIREDGVEFGVRHTLGSLIDPYGYVDLNSVMHGRRHFGRAGGWPTTPSPENWRRADGVFWRRLCAVGCVFEPLNDGRGPTDVKRFREQGVDARVIRGEVPWTT